MSTPEKTEPTPFEELADAHDQLSDDELAVALKDHADVNVLLALWRRIRGDVAKPEATPASVPARQSASGSPASG